MSTDLEQAIEFLYAYMETHIEDPENSSEYAVAKALETALDAMDGSGALYLIKQNTEYQEKQLAILREIAEKAGCVSLKTTETERNLA